MDGERKINLSEGVPLNTPENNSPTDVGVHINTTFSIASSRKFKLILILNFLLIVICVIISCSGPFYYWNEISSLRRELNTVKDQLVLQSLKDTALSQEKVQAGALTFIRPRQLDREPRMDAKEDLPEHKIDLPFVPQKDVLVAHFTGASKEVNLGTNAIIGPWKRDGELSSKNSASKIELYEDHVKINESGLYFVYAQIVYLSQAPNCYFVWARQSEPPSMPRLIASCSSADDSSSRPLDKSQISCMTQSVARLNKGDIVNLSQREHNRTLWLRPGYSYFGFIKLTS